MTNMTTTTNTTTSRTQIRLLSTTAIFAALITIMTAYVCHIPVPIAGGYLHFGDSLIFLAATILPRPYALAAAAIGGPHDSCIIVDGDQVSLCCRTHDVLVEGDGHLRSRSLLHSCGTVCRHA